MDKAWRNMMNPFAEGTFNICTGEYIKSGNGCREEAAAEYDRRALNSMRPCVFGLPASVPCSPILPPRLGVSADA
ncbi:hypothetical protein D3C78_697620 [compost metagenome]